MPSFSGTHVLPCTLQNFSNHFSFCSAASHLARATTIRLFVLINYCKLKMLKKKDTCPSARGMLTNGTLLCWGTDLLLFNML